MFCFVVSDTFQVVNAVSFIVSRTSFETSTYVLIEKAYDYLCN